MFTPGFELAARFPSVSLRHSCPPFDVAPPIGRRADFPEARRAKRAARYRFGSSSYGWGRLRSAPVRATAAVGAGSPPLPAERDALDHDRLLRAVVRVLRNL